MCFCSVAVPCDVYKTWSARDCPRQRSLTSAPNAIFVYGIHLTGPTEWQTAVALSGVAQSLLARRVVARAVVNEGCNDTRRNGTKSAGRGLVDVKYCVTDRRIAKGGEGRCPDVGCHDTGFDHARCHDSGCDETAYNRTKCNYLLGNGTIR